ASVARIISSDLLARGYLRVHLWAGLVALISNVGLNILLIPRLGVSGAALATSISYSLNAIVLVAAFVKITSVPAFVLLLPGGGDLRLFLEGIRKALSFRKTPRP
ncbi:MAG: polysaccharide biosynthesis C-terminal domain-containing protein, partial [bacterium]